MCDENARGRTDPRPPVVRRPWVPPVRPHPVMAVRRIEPAAPRTIAAATVPPTASRSLPWRRDAARAVRAQAATGRRGPASSHSGVWQFLPNPLGARGRSALPPHIGPYSRRPATKGPGTPGPPPARVRRPRQSLAAPRPLRPRRSPAPPQDTSPSRPTPAVQAIGMRDATCHPPPFLSREISAIRRGGLVKRRRAEQRCTRRGESCPLFGAASKIEAVAGPPRPTLLRKPARTDPLT
jgi:hypothetical protein